MFEIFSIVFKWLKKIILVTIIAGVGSAAVSLMLPNKYKSTVKFMSSSPNLLDKKLYMKEESERPMWLFGGKHDMDRLIQLSESRSLIDYAIKKFDLYEHYNIADDEKKRFNVEEKLLQNYKIIKDPLGALELNVIDKDPDFAADLANDLIHKIDQLDRAILMEKKVHIIDILKQDVQDRKHDISALIDSIKLVGNSNPGDTITTKVLTEMLNNQVEDYNFTSSSYNQFRSLLGEDMSSVYILEPAVPAIVKESPKRSMLVLGTMFFAFGLMLVIAILTEKFKEYRAEQQAA